MTQVLLEEVNPNGNLQAIVESTEDVCFLYLVGAPETKFATRTTWIRNHRNAPASLNVDGMKQGNPPCQPATHCHHPDGLPVPDAADLRVSWLPEGNGVALYESGKMLAAIPPWSGHNGFDGYSVEAVGEGPLAWELDDQNVLIERFENADKYWSMWDEGKPWESVQSSQIASMEKALGAHSNYYAIDGDDWPPKAMLRIPTDNGIALVTIGLCLRPQPNVEMYTETPERYRRIELGILVPKDSPDDVVNQCAAYLSAQSSLPWSYYSWLGPGHTLSCDSWMNTDFTAAIFTAEHQRVTKPDLDPFMGDPVNLLWMLPISSSERELAQENGSQSLFDQLPAERWSEI